MDEPMYNVVWPRSPRGRQRQHAAERLDTLGGKTIAFLWDHLFRGDEIFPLIQAQIERDYPTAKVIGYDDFGNTHGSNEKQMIAGLAEALRSRSVDAVISGLGC